MGSMTLSSPSAKRSNLRFRVAQMLLSVRSAQIFFALLLMAPLGCLSSFQRDTRVRYQGRTVYVQRRNRNGTYDLYTGSGEDDAVNVPKKRLALARNSDNDYVSRRRLGWKPSDNLRRRREGFHHSHNQESIRYQD